LRGSRTIGDRTLSLVRDTPAGPRALRVLCVDDEEDIRVILELALSLDAMMTAEVVADGETMLRKAATGEYDVFLLDAMMPGTDGYEVCRRLQADPATRNVPAVFLTARTQREDVDRARSLGAAACLKKPFDPMTLSQELRAAIASS
jgi:CheY-like chemotaxis protein